MYIKSFEQFVNEAIRQDFDVYNMTEEDANLIEALIMDEIIKDPSCVRPPYRWVEIEPSKDNGWDAPEGVAAIYYVNDKKICVTQFCADRDGDEEEVDIDEWYFDHEKYKTIDESAVNEGLIGAIKARKQIVNLQGTIADAIDKLIEDNPKKYNSGKDVMNAIAKFAKEKYEEMVTEEDAISYDEWWKSYSKANIALYDRILKQG